nr:protein kinase [Lachnospiraceae bacterium]
MTIRTGMFINDRYEIIDKVGSGGMADVYKAKDHRLNRFVAVKILKAEFSNDVKFVEKFRAEAQAAAGLSHPNVVNVYDVGDENDMYYIVMELVEGITLKSFIERKGKLGVKEAVGIAIQIAQGMEAAHSNHIVHRDIKPQNIIISREGKVKVTDFGIAKAISSDTVTSNAMGSVHYLSPEQARGGFSDEKSDIYSLGVTMYEMLTGRVPFVGENTVSVALSHLQDDPIPLRSLEPSIPVSLDRIVQKCMQKRSEYRYLSASALINDLKLALSQPD